MPVRQQQQRRKQPEQAHPPGLAAPTTAEDSEADMAAASAKPARRKAKAAAKAEATAKLSGPAQALHRLGLVRDIDLALHLPLRHEDETRLVPVAQTRGGEVAQVQGVVRSCRVEHRSRRQLLVELDDGSGALLLLRLLHFYPSQQQALAPGRCVRARGEVRAGMFGREMVHPVLKVVEPDAPLPLALTPVYPASAQLPQAYLRKAVAAALQQAPLHELLPPGTVPPGLPSLRDALAALHLPQAGTLPETLDDRASPAWQRLKFDELLAQQLSQAFSVRERAALQAPPLPRRRGGLSDGLLAALPFALTAAQRRVGDEIARDLARTQPMHRLLQGDVGSGKTVVAALAAAAAIDAGWQCALMAPTEILAEQHFRKLIGWLQPQGVTLAWLTGSRKGRARQAMVELVESGEAALVVGTHAVIQADVAFARLGLAVVDEQHRFGVAQRLALRGKAGPSVPCAESASPSNGRDGADGVRMAPALSRAAGALEPHLLMMSATPIPRTLAMTYYADLDVSTLDELPPGRAPVQTRLFADSRRDQVLARMSDEVAQGRQVYWVCPLVDESEHLDLQNATATHAQLAAALPQAMVGLLHGRMPAAEKAAVMALFTDGRMPVLVATTVIEVGVDVPNASLMVVEHAERFGLAQLHQLRGRIGRGSTASVCVLLYSAPLSATAKGRLQAMLDTTDGFEIARRDLAIRGPGEFMGARQSGDALLRFADLAADDALLQQARAVVPSLLAQHPAAARAHVERWLGRSADYLKA